MLPETGSRQRVRVSSRVGTANHESGIGRTVATLVILATCAVLFNPTVTAYALAASPGAAPATPFPGFGNQSASTSGSVPSPIAPVAGPAPSGTVSQGNSSLQPTSQSTDAPVTLDSISGVYRYTAPYGVFDVDPSKPYALNAVDKSGDTNVQTVFTALVGGKLLQPGPGSVTANATSATLKYGLYDGATPEGTMIVQVAFSGTKDKISVSFSQFAGATSSTQLVWLGLTGLPYIATANPGSDYSRVDGFVPVFGTQRLGNLTLFATGTAFASAERDPTGTGRTVLDSADASGSFAGNYVAVGVHLGVLKGSALVTLYDPGVLTLDPSLFAQPASGSPQFSDQRYTFYDGQRYWAFWYESSTFGIEYRNSVDGRSWSPPRYDVPGRTGYGDTLGLSLGFTVLNKGRLVEIVWADTAGGTSAKRIMLSSGLIQGDQIVWAQSTANVLSTDSTSYSIRQPVTATFTTAGEIAYVYILDGAPANLGPGVYYGRFACNPSAFACSNGYTNEVQVSVGIASSLLPDTFTIGLPVAVPGPQDGILVFFSGPTTRQDSNLWIYGDYSPQSKYTNAMIDCFSNVTWYFNLPAYPPWAIFSAAPFGTGAQVYMMLQGSGLGLTSKYILGTCQDSGYGSDITISPSGTTKGYAEYITAAMDSADQAVDVFWENVTTGQIQGAMTGGQEFANIPVPWSGSYVSSTGLTSSLENNGQFLALTFVMAGSPQSVYFASLPTRLDFSVGPNNPWVQEPNAPLFSEFGGSINPATGLIKFEAQIASFPGTKITESLNLLYEEPSLFYGTTPSPYLLPNPSFPGQWSYGYAVNGIMWTDLPWLDVYAQLLHMPGGSTYHYSFDFTNVWFNNTVGLQFSLKYLASTNAYAVYMPNGDTYSFGTFGNLIGFADASGNTLQYLYDSNHRMYFIEDSYGRGIHIGYSGTSSQICTVSYGSSSDSRTATFSYGGSACATSSSTSVTSTDIMGRRTTFVLTNGLLSELDLPTGGRVSYTYGSASSGSILEGSDLYGLPVLSEAIYNQSAYNVLTRTDQFNYRYQDGRVTYALYNFYDPSGVLQGSTEYQFHQDLGYGTVRVLDATGQVLNYDMETLTGSGAMQDLSGNGNNGAISGAVSTPGIFGMARLFNGVNNNINAGNGASVNLNGKTLSMSAWIYPRTAASQEIIINKENSYEVGLLSGVLQAAVQISGGPVWAWGSSAYALPINAWSQVAFVYDGHLPLSQQWNFYVNGNLVNQIAPPNGATGSIATTSASLLVGMRSAVACGSSPTGCPFNGTIESLHLYNRALTSDEVYSLYAFDAVQRSLTKSWFSGANGQPSRTEAFNGASRTPSSITSNARDNWGNVIFSQDAYGNSTYASYANTNNQDRFYQAGSLQTTTSGKVFADDFSTSTSDFVTTSSGSPPVTVSSDYSTFGQSPPSLKFAAPGGSSSSSVTLTKTFAVAQAGYLVAETNVRFDANQPASTAYFYFNVDSTTGVAIDLAFNSGSLIAYLGSNWATCASYTSNFWYRITVVYSVAHSYTVYVNGQQSSCAALTPLTTAAVSGIHYALGENAGSTTASVWMDDIAVTNSDTVTVNGLVPSEKVFLNALNGDTMGAYQVTGSTATVSFDRSHPVGQATLQISAVDSTIEYQTPFDNVFGGDTYTFLHPATLDDRLTQTRSGFTYWGSTVVDGGPPSGTTSQGCPVVGSTTIPCDFHWSSVPTVTGNQVLQNRYVATNATGYEFLGNLWTPQSSDYYAQYVYIPYQYSTYVAQSPAELRIAMVNFFQNGQLSGYALSAPTWGLSSTAGYAGIECFNICLYSYAPYLGQFPNVTDGWAKFVFKGTDLFQTGVQNNELGFFLSNGQAILGPLVKGDSSITSVTVAGLSYYTTAGKTASVLIYDGSQRLISSGSVSSGDSVTLALDPGTSGIRINSFPFQGHITITTYSGGVTTPVISNETLAIWGGDVFRFMGASGFYDASLVQANSGIHDAIMGMAQPYGDCLDAIACYDMETVRSDPAMTIGTGSVQNYMVDLSRHGNDAVLNDVSLGAGIVGQSAALDGVEDYVQASNTASLQVTGDITVSMWVYLSKPLDCDSNNNWRSLLAKQSSGGSDFGSYYLFLEQSQLPSWSVTVGGVAQRFFPTTGVVGVGAWTHVLFTRSASSGLMQYYENGTLVTSSTPGTGSIDTSTGPLRIGSGTTTGVSCPNGDGAFPGSVDQVVIYPRVLSPAQIRALYTARTPEESRDAFGSTPQGLTSQVGVLNGGNYVTALYSYNSQGELTTTNLNGNKTYNYYANFYNSGYMTRLQRADTKNILYSYDPNTGQLLDTVNTDCTHTRTVYDLGGRATQVLQYNEDPQSALYLDMETVTTSDLNTGAWTWFDLSCQENSAAITSNGLGSGTSVPGPQGMAQNFNGASNYIEVPDSTALHPAHVTVSAWIRPTSFPTANADIVDRSYPSASPSGYVLYMLANQSVAFAVADGTTFHASVSKPILTANVWQLVTGVYDGSHVTVYVNGAGYNPVPFSGAISYAQTQALIVGCSYAIYASGACSRWFPGGIDEVHVLTTGVPAPGIASLHNFQWGLLSSRTNAYDDMTIITGGFGGSQLPGYQYPSMTQYDPTSIPRSLYYDMQTQLLVTTGGVHVLEDLSGNGQDGTLQGTSSTQNLPTFVPGKIGQALKFQSANTQWIDIHTNQPSSLNLTQAVSVAAWVDITGTGSVDTVLAKGYFTSLQYDLDVHLQSGGSWVVGASLKNAAGTTVALASATTVPVNSWTHVAFTYDGNTVRIYVNGVADANTAALQAPLALSIYDATVGVYPNSPTTYFFDGMIDELQVFPAGLTAAQVLAVYQGTDTSHVVKQYFDGLGRSVRGVLMDFSGHRLTEEVRALGWNDQPSADYMPNGQANLYSYNFVGGIVTATSPSVNGVSSQEEVLQFDMQRKTVVVDPLGRVSYGTADLLGRTVETGGYNPSNGTYNRTRTGYDAIGLQVSEDVLLPSGAKQQATTTLYYNSAGKVVFTIYPDGTTASYTYDKDLRPSTSTDPMGRVAIYAYVSSGVGSGMGWVASVTLKASASAGTGYATTLTYDGSDNVYKITNGTTIITRLYDPLHELTSETYTIPSTVGGTGASLTQNYFYDSAGRPTSIIYPNGNNASYAYDYFGRISKVLFGAGVTPTLYATIGYDSAGRLAKIWYAQAGTNTSVSATYTYDAMNRVSTIGVAGSTAGYLSDTYAYDAASQVTQIVDDMFTGNRGASNPKTETFAYDANGRLAQATGPFSPSTVEGAWGIQYSYDAVGNIRSRTECSGGTFPCPSGSTTTYTYNYANWNQLSSLSGATSDSFTYNGDGSTTGRSGYTYRYDYSQRLVNITDTQGNSHTYSYDAFGRRIATVDNCVKNRCITKAVTYVNYYAYAGTTLTYAVNQSSGLASVYVYAGGMLLFRADSSAAGLANFYAQDASNNVRLIWNDASGSVTVGAKLRYEPFGQEAKDIVSGTTLLKFDGQQALSIVPLYYMGARYYDPELGRFLSRDPSGFHGYSYASDNPVSYEDPTGLITQSTPVLSGVGQKLMAEQAAAQAAQQAQNDANTRKILFAIITIIAVVVLTVVTCGAAAPLILVAAAAVGAAFAAEQYFVAGVRDPVQLFSDFATGFAIGAAVGGGVAAIGDYFALDGVDFVGVDLEDAEVTDAEVAPNAAASSGENPSAAVRIIKAGTVGGTVQSSMSTAEDYVSGRPITALGILENFAEGFAMGAVGEFGSVGGEWVARETGMTADLKYFGFLGKALAAGGSSAVIGYLKGTHSPEGLFEDATIGVLSGSLGDALPIGDVGQTAIGTALGESATCSLGLPDCGLSQTGMARLWGLFHPFNQPMGPS